MTEAVLVADIGGTNARFALASKDLGAINIENVKKFRAKDFENISGVLDAYLSAVPVRPKAACFAVAGPVTGSTMEFTNSPWRLNAEDIKSAFSLKSFSAINDFAALACSIRRLNRSDVLSVKPGTADDASPALVIGPGTGFGQALIVPCHGSMHIIPTEGGHIAVAPVTDEERAVIEFIARETHIVSVEKLLSGPGLVNIYQALCAARGAPGVFVKAREITAAAMERTCPVAERTVGLFCEFLGRIAGDAVLAAGARGGVFLGGGILPKIQDMLLGSKFQERFLDKGPMRSFVEPVPVGMIIRDDAALIGAAATLLE